MNLTSKQLATMIDVSAVKADSSLEEVKSAVKAAIQYRFISVFTLPSFSPLTKQLLENDTDILLGGTVGFPSGSSLTSTKAFEADELLELGCKELDMVINIGKLKSDFYEDVSKDIQKIVEIAGEIPVKVILEVGLLNEKEIQSGAKIIRDSGAKFIKSGTGWNGATNTHHIHLIKEAVGDSINIKVAGGVRKIDALLEFVGLGVSRFGVSYLSAVNIMDEFIRMNEE